jgi:hypothetical protein
MMIKNTNYSQVTKLSDGSEPIQSVSKVYRCMFTNRMEKKEKKIFNRKNI